MKLHILKSISPTAKDFDFNEAVERCDEWLITTLSPICCFRSDDGRELKCSCLSIFNLHPDTTTVAARYMVSWAGFSMQQKREILNTWDRYSAVTPGKKYILPLDFEDKTKKVDDVMVCRNSVMNILNVGRKMLVSARKDPSKEHGHFGKVGADTNRGRKFGEMDDSLHAFFIEVQSEGLPFATRIIREKTGLTTRDDDPDDVTLPPHMTKRRIYTRWCWSRGWKVEMKSRQKGIYCPSKEYSSRPHDDDSEIPLWPSGSEAKDVCSWTKFIHFWKYKYSNIKMRKRGADTCTDCLKSANDLCVTASQGRQTNDDGGSGSDEEAVSAEIVTDGSDDNLQLVSAINSVEQKLSIARLHVLQYQVQRNLVNCVI